MEPLFNSNVKEIDNMSWHVVERILIIFYENGSLKKSQITLKSGLKYNTCMRYLKWLEEKMEFITFDLTSDNKNIKSIHLSSQGISFCKNKISEKKNTNTKKNRDYLSA